MSDFDTDFAAASDALRQVFWSPVTFQPAGGGPARSISVSCDERSERLDREEYREDEVDEIWFSALFDVDDTNYGGIADSELRTEKDVATIIGPNDSPSEPWGFMGEVRNRTTNDRQLKFSRRGPRQYGGPE